jgi:hypothetical protein
MNLHETNAAAYDAMIDFRLLRRALLAALCGALMFALLPALLVASSETAWAQTERASTVSVPWPIVRTVPTRSLI